MDIFLGQIVMATAGRECGQLYVVTGFAGGRQVFLADGRRRRVDCPKKKNIRHVKVLNTVATSVADKMNGPRPVTDEDIRQALVDMQK